MASNLVESNKNPGSAEAIHMRVPFCFTGERRVIKEGAGSRCQLFSITMREYKALWLSSKDQTLHRVSCRTPCLCRVNSVLITWVSRNWSSACGGFDYRAGGKACGILLGRVDHWDWFPECNNAVGNSVGEGGWFSLHEAVGDLSVWLRMRECKWVGGAATVCVWMWRWFSLYFIISNYPLDFFFFFFACKQRIGFIFIVGWKFLGWLLSLYKSKICIDP